MKAVSTGISVAIVMVFAVTMIQVATYTHSQAHGTLARILVGPS